MNITVIDGPAVRARLSMGECIEAMVKAMSLLHGKYLKLLEFYPH
jgi:hypothetical protein